MILDPLPPGGEVAIVTGASRGLRKAMAAGLLEAGGGLAPR